SRKNKSRPGSTPEPSPAVRVSQNKAGTAAGSGQNPGRNPGKVMSNEAYAAGKRKPLYEDGDPKGSSGDDYSGFKRKYDERDYFTAPRKTAGPGAAPGSSRPAAAAGSSRKTPPQDDYEYEETESSGLLKIIFAVTAIVFLIVLIFLCVKINSLNKQLNTALAANAASGDSATLQLANDQLTQQNTDLKNQVNTLTQQLNGLGAQPGDNTQPTDGTPATAPPATSSPGGSTPATAKPDATTTPASPGAGKTYTVVGGDTLSKIAQNEYGSSSKDNIQKIVDANGITDPNSLKVGQVLTIPAQ
ncbi:MAG: LysM peptidoglycan-binding domain-containing protein, partial [Defluviitaleaceae bacterium]|nr:LysM peptidoglycan-binding domain-containing protein [Defluviitaleaceae bacterium]